MSKVFVSFICLLITISTNSQNLIGAWEGFSNSEQGIKIKTVVTFAEGYYVMTSYEDEGGKFISTNGGAWKLDSSTLTQKIEFDATNSENVGTEISSNVLITEAAMEMTGNKTKFKRIDKGTPGKLHGAWLMSGRVRDGKTETRDTTIPRKTMKVLSGTRFQWIAYNIATKQFMGTGGGTYTTINGKYTENIEFFSKDETKVGLSLTFDYSLENGEWNHKGFSSKGDPLHEIWSKRK